MKKKLRWARYVACLGKRCVQVSEEKGDGKRHVEDVEVDGEKKLTANKWVNSTLPLYSKIDWGSGRRHAPVLFTPDQECERARADVEGYEKS